MDGCMDGTLAQISKYNCNDVGQGEYLRVAVKCKKNVFFGSYHF